MGNKKKISNDAEAEVSDKQRAIDVLRERFTKVVQTVIRGPHRGYYSRGCSRLRCGSECKGCDFQHPHCDTWDGVRDSVYLQENCIPRSDLMQCHNDTVPKDDILLPDTPV